jgi:hypothetical protein
MKRRHNRFFEKFLCINPLCVDCNIVEVSDSPNINNDGQLPRRGHNPRLVRQNTYNKEEVLEYGGSQRVTNFPERHY